jgi:hypothetical protein
LTTSGGGIVALVLALAACTPSAPAGDAGPTPPAATPPAPSAATHATEAPPKAPPVPCRAIAVEGQVTSASAGADAGAALALHGEIPDGAWLALGAGARLVAKDPRTTRETTFRGPGRVRTCVDDREESWVTEGRFESATGAGETPGAEEWVVTPLGVVRYMAAQAAADVRPRSARVQATSGAVFLWAPEAAAIRRASGKPDGGVRLDDDGWVRVEPEDGEVVMDLEAPASTAPREIASAAIRQCDTLTRRARELAALLFQGPGASDAGTAKDQVRTRRLARAACSVAALRVDGLPPSEAKEEMSARLKGGAPAP